MATNNKRLRRDYDAAKARMPVSEDNKQEKMIGDTLSRILSIPTDATVGNVSVIVSKGLIMEGKPNEVLQDAVRCLVTETLNDDQEPNYLQDSVRDLATTSVTTMFQEDDDDINELQESVVGVITTKMNQPTVKDEDGYIVVNELQGSTLHMIMEYLNEGAGVVGRQGRPNNGMQNAVMELSRHAMGETVSKDDYDKLKNDFESFKEMVFVCGVSIIAILFWLSLRP